MKKSPRSHFNLYHIFKLDQQNNPMPRAYASRLRKLLQGLFLRK